MSYFNPQLTTPQNQASYMPDVDRHYAQYGIGYQVPTYWEDRARYSAILEDSRVGLEAYAKEQSGITSQIPHIAPPLHPERLIRWQLGVSILGGIMLVCLYSYITKRPVIQ
jgi:hypothetical protein